VSDSPSSRTVKRSDGKASKEAILEATLIIILRDGLRDVKYKTVAEVSGVTQSAIGYYFKDIPALIHEAFLFYLEGYKQEMDALRSAGLTLLEQHQEAGLDQQATREKIIEPMTQSLFVTMGSDSEEVKSYLLLDRLFRNESLQNPGLYGDLIRQDQLDIDALTRFFEQLGCAHPESDALQLMSLLWYLSERLMQYGYTEEQQVFAKQMIRQRLATSLGLDN